jgi:hypothetical protein
MLSKCDNSTELKVVIHSTKVPIDIDIGQDPNLYKFFTELDSAFVIRFINRNTSVMRNKSHLQQPITLIFPARPLIPNML